MVNRLLTALLILLPVILSCQIEYTTEAANRALTARDYRQAIQILDSLEAGGEVSPNFYLTKGNAHFEAGEPGRAILAYERGIRLRPGHRDLQNNLRYVREETGLTTPDLPDFFLVRGWRVASALLGSTAAFSISLLCWWLAVAGAVWWYLRKDMMEEKRRFALLPAAILFALLALLFYGMGNSRIAELQRSDEAILLDGAILRVSPTADGSIEAQLPEGVKLYISDRVNEYVKVQLADGQTGYLPAESVGVI